jgi:hypothetical protein
VNGAKFAVWPKISGTVMIANSVSAAILMATSTELTVALSLVPITSSHVTKPVTRTAGRLMSPPTSPPSRKPQSILGPTVSACGKCTPNPSRKPTIWPDHPTATALAPSAYSRISAQPTSQAINSPITA